MGQCWRSLPTTSRQSWHTVRNEFGRWMLLVVFALHINLNNCHTEGVQPFWWLCLCILWGITQWALGDVVVFVPQSRGKENGLYYGNKLKPVMATRRYDVYDSLPCNSCTLAAVIDTYILKPMYCPNYTHTHTEGTLYKCPWKLWLSNWKSFSICLHDCTPSCHHC